MLRQPETKGPYRVGISRLKHIAGMLCIGGYKVIYTHAPEDTYQPRNHETDVCHCKDDFTAVHIAELLNVYWQAEERPRIEAARARMAEIQAAKEASA